MTEIINDNSYLTKSPNYEWKIIWGYYDFGFLREKMKLMLEIIKITGYNICKPNLMKIYIGVRIKYF